MDNQEYWSNFFRQMLDTTVISGSPSIIQQQPPSQINVLCNTTTIDCLPPEILDMIFKYVNADQLLTSCRLVSTYWYEVISGFKMKKLVVSAFKYYNSNKWFHTKERFDHCGPQVLRPSVFAKFYNHKMFKGLTHLKIDHYNGLDWNILNRFVHLTHLEIECDADRFMGVKFFLPKLVSLAILNCHQHSLIAIQADSLTDLCIPNGLLGVTNPNTVLRLHESNLPPPIVEEMVNLEYMSCVDLQIFTTNILFRLPKLKEIHYKVLYRRILMKSSIRTIEDVKTELHEFMERRTAHGRSDLKVYVCGVQLEEEKSIDEYGFDEDPIEANERIYMLNYEKLSYDLSFITEINYSNLINAVKDKFLPVDFFNKFSNLRYITCGRVQNEDHLLWFLREIGPQLQFISLTDACSLSQRFYNALPTFHSLNYFIIHGNPNLVVDFEFLFAMRALACFRITDITLTSVRQILYAIMFQRLLRNFLITFKIGEYYFEITFNGKDIRIEHVEYNSTERFKFCKKLKYIHQIFFWLNFIERIPIFY